MNTNRFELVILNRNEYAMSREDDFAQTASVRRFIDNPTEFSDIDRMRLAIDANEPFATWTPWDQLDPEEQDYRRSIASKQHVWVAYADGKVLTMEPAGPGAYTKVSDTLAGYVATQRLLHGREVEAPCMDRVSLAHVTKQTTPEPARPLLRIVGDEVEVEPAPYIAPGILADAMPGEETIDHLPYVENVTEGAIHTRGIVRQHEGAE